MHYTNFVLNHREVGLQWRYYKTNMFFYQHNTVDSINLLKRKMTLNPSYYTVSCVPLYTPEKYKAITDFKLLRNLSSNFLYIGITLSGFFLKMYFSIFTFYFIQIIRYIRGCKFV